MKEWLLDHPVVTAIGLIIGGGLISQKMGERHHEKVNEQRIRALELTKNPTDIEDFKTYPGDNSKEEGS